MIKYSEDNRPQFGDWVMYLEIAKHGGHMHSSLIQWSKDIQDRIEEEIDEKYFYWCMAKPAAVDMMRSRLISKRDEHEELLTLAENCEIQIYGIKDDIERLSDQPTNQPEQLGLFDEPSSV